MVATSHNLEFLLPAKASLADPQRHSGNLPSERIRLFPRPGTARPSDVEFADRRHDRLRELIDGVPVEKTRGAYTSRLALAPGIFLQVFLREHDPGMVAAAAGTRERFE